LCRGRRGGNGRVVVRERWGNRGWSSEGNQWKRIERWQKLRFNEEFIDIEVHKEFNYEKQELEIDRDIATFEARHRN
jgi:hypothetical protein